MIEPICDNDLTLEDIIEEIKQIEQDNEDIIKEAIAERDKRIQEERDNPKPETFAELLNQLRHLDINHLPTCPETKRPGSCDATSWQCEECLAGELDALEAAHIREVQEAKTNQS